VSGFLVVVVLLGLVWLFIVLPVRRRQKATSALHEAMQDALVPGDEIITAGGLYATVRAIDEDRLEIEIAPGVIVALDRRAVAAVAEEVEDVEEAEEAAAEQEELEPEPNEPGPENDGQPR
jgi:preprotein translocase subunit YajC